MNALALDAWARTLNQKIDSIFTLAHDALLSKEETPLINQVNRALQVLKAEGPLVVFKKARGVLSRRVVSRYATLTDSLKLLLKALESKTKKTADAQAFQKLFVLLNQKKDQTLFCPDPLFHAFVELNNWFQSKKCTLIPFSKMGSDLPPKTFLLIEPWIFSRPIVQQVLEKPLKAIWTNQHYALLTNDFEANEDSQARAIVDSYKNEGLKRIKLEELGGNISGPLNSRFKVRPFSSDQGIIGEVFNTYVSRLQRFHFDNEPEHVIDIGGQIGSFSVLTSLLYPKAQCFSYEPEPENFEYLSQNASMNSAGRINPYQMAVSEKKGTLNLFIDPNDGGGHRLETGNVTSVRHVEVAVTTLRDIVQENKIPFVDILKVDVEGSELKVLRGGKDILKNLVKSVFVETGQGVLGGTQDDVINLLKECGFQLEISGDKGVCLIFGYK